MKCIHIMPFTLLAALGLSACDTDKRNTMVGTLERDRIEIVVESNEPIIAIPARDGQRVSAGSVILEQDPARFEALMAQVQAQVDQARARLAELQRGPRKEAISEAQARLQAARSLSANTHKDLQRAQDIFDRGLSNQAALDNARTQWQNADANEKALHEALASLLNGTTVEELQQAEAVVAAAQAALAQSQIDLQRSTVRAPIDGVIDKVLYQLGERPVPGSTVAIELDEQRSYARIYVPEYQRARVQPGDTLIVRIDGHPQDVQGTVAWVSSDASFTPYFALTEHDRSRLSYLAEVDVDSALGLPVGLPLEAWLPEFGPDAD